MSIRGMVDELVLINGKYLLFILIGDYVGPREGFPDAVARKDGEYIPRCECVSGRIMLDMHDSRSTYLY